MRDRWRDSARARASSAYLHDGDHENGAHALTAFEPAQPRGHQDPPAEPVAFCGYCGTRPAGDAARESRVCERCRLGLILTAAAGLAPGEGEPFVVVDELMRIRAVSRRAERLLGVTETEAVHHHLGDFLLPVEGSSDALGRLTSAIAVASRLDAPAQRAVLRPREAFGVRYGVRIGGCAPGPAAVVVLADGL